MKFFFKKLLAVKEEDRFSIKEIFTNPIYRRLLNGEKEETSYMYGQDYDEEEYMKNIGNCQR